MRIIKIKFDAFNHVFQFEEKIIFVRCLLNKVKRFENVCQDKNEAHIRSNCVSLTHYMRSWRMR